MTRSRAVRFLVPWLALMLVFAVDTVGIVVAAVLIFGGSFGAGTALWVLVFSLFLWAVPLARLVRPRTGVPVTEDSDLIARQEGQRGSAHRFADDDLLPRGGPARWSTLARPFAATTSSVPAGRVHVPAPRSQHLVAADDLVAPNATGPGLDADPGIPDQMSSVEEPGVQALPAPTPADGRPPAPDKPMDADEPDLGGAAQRLAEVLNLYERLETSARDGTDTARGDSSGPPRHDVGDRGLWDELVEDYGAESIDFRGGEDGACCITLVSGDLVVYIPARRCWMWATFEIMEQTSLIRSGSMLCGGGGAESI